MTTFLLIRHGSTNALGAFVPGRAPGVLLNRQGEEEATTLGERLKSVPLAAIISSPLDRTRQTAAAIARHHPLDVEDDCAFIEIETGDWTGAAFTDLEQRQEWHRFNRVRSLTRTPSGESMLAAQHRAVERVLQLRDQYQDATIAIVTHADIIRAVLTYCLGMPLDLLLRIEISPCRVTILRIDEETAIVDQINGDGL